MSFCTICIFIRATVGLKFAPRHMRTTRDARGRMPVAMQPYRTRNGCKAHQFCIIVALPLPRTVHSHYRPIFEAENEEMYMGRRILRI
ncbi:hypothetical protein EDB19DRAFT_273793 [Suillus lakei]|nr:hypothetical protein EDB19DRAFT_273793 [Suillus lakei]